MELKHIKELMTAMGRTGTKKLLIKKEGFELQLERENGSERILDTTLENEDFLLRNENALQRASLALSKGKEASVGAASGIIPTEPSEETAGAFITSPMVGTYYSTPAPDEPSFVKVGDKVEKNSVVCIVEAMKVMNEVKAGIAGTITEILVENGHPVEFGTKLFRIT